MDKKQRISWGVSFGSLALVAGMVSYFGLSNNGQANNQGALTQSQTANNQSNLQSQDGFTIQQRPGHGRGFDQSFSGNNSSQSDDSNDQSSTNTDQFYGDSNQQGQFSNGEGPRMRHQGGFDTTTGGT
jgi:hypothetical protein